MGRDVLKGEEEGWEQGWGNGGDMITKPVTIKAMLRVGADLAREDADVLPIDARAKRWEKRLFPWKELLRTFLAERLYERFPAKAQVRRVCGHHRELARAADTDAENR